MDGETGTPGLIPTRSFSGVVGKVGVYRGRSPGSSSREEILRDNGSLIETRFSIEGDTGVAFGTGLGIEPGLGGGA